MADVNKFLIIRFAPVAVLYEAADVVIPTVGMDMSKCLIHIPLSVDDEEAVVGKERLHTKVLPLLLQGEEIERVGEHAEHLGVPSWADKRDAFFTHSMPLVTLQAVIATLAIGEQQHVVLLAIFDANKQDLMPDIPTIDELNIPELKGLYSSSDRGLIATKNLDPAIVPIIVEALKKTQVDPDFIKDATEQGMAINMLFGDDFTNFIDNVEKTIKDLKIYGE